MKYFIFFVSFIFIIWLCVIPVDASVLKMSSDFTTLHVGDVFTVDITIDTQAEMLNAVETSIIFPSNLIAFESSDDGASIVSLWMHKPQFDGSNTISLSGITPGGFSQKNAPLISLTFKVIDEGQGNIESTQSQLLLHDGLGTQDTVTQENVHIAVVSGESNIVMNTDDDESPEHFVPIIVQDRDMFDGAFALIFSTEDKGSGLDRYEVKEGLLGMYKITQSPYQLVHQSLDTALSVKAIDKNGNVRTEILYPQNLKPWYKDPFLPGTILISCVLISLIVGFCVRHFFRK